LHITKIRTHPVRMPMRQFSDAYSDYSVCQFVLVEVETDEGVVGYGEAPCTVTVGFYGETLESTAASIKNYIAPRLEGEDPLNIRKLISLTSLVHGSAVLAKTAVDLALYDIAGKALEIPTSTLLGGAQRDVIKAASEIPITTPDKMVDEARRLVEMGFKVIKIKAGRDVDDEIRGVKAVRDAIGYDFELRVDPNGGWSRHDSLRALRALMNCDLSYVEQPLPRWDLDGLAELRHATSVPIMADESVWNSHDVVKVAERGAADIINIKITKAGGLKNSLDIYTTAQAFGIPCVIGTELEACVGIAGKLHLAASLETLPFACEFTELAFQEMTIMQPLTLMHGELEVPKGAGLGVNPDKRVIEGHTANVS
jgi:L-alanine-DL-glutamate epimerase-like enolase superfamily enzyme